MVGASKSVRDDSIDDGPGLPCHRILQVETLHALSRARFARGKVHRFCQQVCERARMGVRLRCAAWLSALKRTESPHTRPRAKVPVESAFAAEQVLAHCGRTRIARLAEQGGTPGYHDQRHQHRPAHGSHHHRQMPGPHRGSSLSLILFLREGILLITGVLSGAVQSGAETVFRTPKRQGGRSGHTFRPG